MAKNPHIINKIKQAQEVSLNARFPFKIVAADFNKYINEIDTFFTTQEAFTWISLVTAATDTITVVLDCVTDVTGVTFERAFDMRVGSTYTCRAVRVRTGTDVSAVFTVGLGS